MSPNRDEEQLLADASTLLMFANAAARQRSPGPPISSGASIASRAPVLQTAAAVKTESRTSPQPSSAPVPRPATQPQYASPVYRTASTNSPPALSQRTPLASYQAPLPQMQPRPSSQPHAPLSATSTASPAPLAPLNQYTMGHQPPANSSPQFASSSLPTSSNSGYALGPPLNSQGRKLDDHRQRSSSPQPPLTTAPTATQSPRSPAAKVKAEETLQRPYVPQKLVPLSPKPPAVHDSLPVQGSFSHTHRRTVSGGLLPKSRSPSVSAPQSAALKRGIDVESGKRSSNNAVIAAAALAAAAEVPLPLKINEGSEKLKGSPLSASHPTESPKSQASTEPAVNEDPAATEAEEDENRTEEEAQTPRMDHAAVPLTKSEKKPIERVQKSVEKAQKSAEKAQKAAGKAAKSADKAPAVTPKDPLERPADVPALEAYKVDPDAGLIGCICEIEEDDGFTIQCDVCFRWQHCSCMGYLNSDEVPEDEYKCYYCDPQKWNRFDPQACKKATVARLESDRVDSPEKPASSKRKSSSSGNDEKKRRRSEKEIKTPTDRPPNEKRKSSAMLSPPSPTVAAFGIHNENNPLLDDGVTAESYMGVYYRLEENDFKTPEIRTKLAELGALVEKAAADEATDSSAVVECMSSSQLKQLKLSKVSLPNHQKYLQDRNETRRSKAHNKTLVKVKMYSDNPKHKFVGISKVGLFISEVGPVSPEMVIPPGTFVIEYLGEVDTFESYATNKVNQYGLWGTVKPKVVRLDIQQPEHEPVRLVVDSRFVGNEARFIRKSCATGANCTLKPVYIPQLQQFKFFVVTTKPISFKGDRNEEELRIAWEWDENHPIREMSQTTADGKYEEGKKFEDFTEEQRSLMMTGVDTIFNFVECACNTTALNSQCSLFKVKRATSYLLRSTRKASNLSTTSLNKFKEDLVVPKSAKDHVSWLQRLKERDNNIHLSLVAIGASGENSDVSDQELQDSEDEASMLQSDSASTGKELSVKMMPRKMLLATGRDFAARKFEVLGSENVNLQTEVTVGVPLTAEIYESIKAKVNEAFRPLAEISSNIKIASETKEVPVEEEKVSKAPAPVAAPAETVAEENKPAAVKKFSFADYKKKMK